MLCLEQELKRKIINFFLRFISIKIDNVYIARGSKIFCPVRLDVGTRINGAIIIKGYGSATIGKYCAIGDGVRIITTNHHTSYPAVQYKIQKELFGYCYTAKSKNVTIGNDVWIGDAAILLPGIKIGNGAIIGAGSIVTRSIDPYSIVAGVPAEIIKKRFTKDIIQLLEEIKWWDWPPHKIQQNKNFFSLNLENTAKDVLKKFLK